MRGYVRQPGSQLRCLRCGPEYFVSGTGAVVNPMIRRREMNKRITSITLVVTIAIVLCQLPAFAQDAPANQNGQVKTDSKMLYHTGPIMSGTAHVYVIWYGCWDDTCGNMGDTNIQAIITDFLSSIGGSPYFQITAMYDNGV